MHNNIAILLALLLAFDSDDDAALPWECEKIEEFYGHGTDYVWQIRSASPTQYCISYLKSSVDAPAFIEAVNSIPTIDGIMA